MTEGCRCERCGVLYQIDLLIPDSLWRQIAGADYVMLCPQCIFDLIEDIVSFAAYRLEPV